jgi:hypothetical protein
MAVSFNLIISDELHVKLQEFTIDYNSRNVDAITKTQMAYILLTTAFKYHSESRLFELVHIILHPPVKSKRELKKDAKSTAQQNKN